eukprot:5089766-Pyramimonas_sp.AAC.1
MLKPYTEGFHSKPSTLIHFEIDHTCVPPLTFHWHWVRVTLALGWHYVGTALALRWHCAGEFQCPPSQNVSYCAPHEKDSD